MNKPRIFVSTVSHELKSSRQLVANTLQSMGYEPVWQDTAASDSGNLQEVLRKRIDTCQGLVQIVGFRYGSEPKLSDEDFGRVSYTQYEAMYYSKSTGRKPWYFIIDKTFPTDSPNQTDESQELQALQCQYRADVFANDSLYHHVSSPDRLERDVLAMKDELLRLRKRFRIWANLVTVLLAIILISIALIIVNQRSAQIQQEIENQRIIESLNEIDDARKQLQIQLDYIKNGVTLIGLDAVKIPTPDRATAQLAEHLEELIRSFDEMYTQDSLIDSQLALIENARSTVYAEATTRVAWNEIFSSERYIHIPVDKRKESFSDLLEAFTKNEPVINDLPIEIRIMRVEICLRLADAHFSRRAASSLNIAEAETFLAKARTELGAIGAEANATKINLFRRLADLNLSDGNIDIAIASYEQMIDACVNYKLEQLSENQLIAIDRNINSAKRKIAMLNAQNCESSIASEQFAELQAASEKMRESYPDNPNVMRDWTVLMNTLIYYKISLLELPSALAIAEQVIDYRKQIYDSEIGNERYLRDYAVAMLALSDVHIAQGKYDEALDILKNATQLLRLGIAMSSGQDERMRMTFMTVISAVAKTQIYLLDPDSAKVTLKELRSEIERYVKTEEPEDEKKLTIDLHAHSTELWHLESLIAAIESQFEVSENARNKALSFLESNYLDLQTQVTQSAELLNLLPDDAYALRKKVAEEGRSAIEQLDLAGRSCLISDKTRAVF